MGSGKRRWKISFHTCPLPVLKQAERPVSVPPEFICPITGSIMADPVIIASGHTFERNCAHACAAHSFEPSLSGGDAVDFSIVIPNLALKSTILSWCRSQLIDPPKPIDFSTAERIVLKLIPNVYSPTNLTGTASEVSVASSDELAAARNQSDSLEEEELFVVPLKSCDIQRQEEALVSLRELTRTREDARSRLSSPRLLSALKSLIASKSSALQVNAVAVLVNLSLDDQNKVKILQSGMVPSLIKLLRCGSAEAQKHAAGAIFSLSLNDQNKTAIGVLGAFSPLLLALGSESERTRHDAAMALFHLSLVQTNHVKMIKLGFVPILLGMVNSGGHMAGRAMLILRNLAASPEGRDAMLDGGAVECLVSFLGRCGFTAVATTESCVAAMYGLSHGGLRFKGLAKVSAAAEVLRKVSESGSAASKEKAVMILEVLMEKEEEEEGIIDWEELLLNSDDDRNESRQRFPANSR